MLNDSITRIYYVLLPVIYLFGGASAISIRMDNVEQVFRTQINIIGQKTEDCGSAGTPERLTKIEVSLSIQKKVLSGTATLLENKLPSTEKWTEMCVLFTNVDAEPQSSIAPIGKELAMPDNMYYCVKLTGMGIEENSKVYKFTGKELEVVENIEEEATKVSDTNAVERRALADRRLLLVMVVFVTLVLFTVIICFFSIKPMR